MTDDFTGLPVGTRLDDQLPGIKFLKYGGMVGGIVVDSVSGHVASFNDAPGCEFCGSGARISFSALQRSVSLHVGLLPVTGVTVQQDLRLTGLDAGGMAVATAIANVTAGTGFDTTLDLAIAEPRIATVVLEAVNDPALLAAIAVRDITFEETTGGQADFFLVGPLGETLVQGGAAADIPVTIMRIGGSSGAIGFTFSQLPAGVTGSVNPNPSLGTGITLHLQADASSMPETRLVVLTGTPTPSAGPAPRSLAMVIATTPKLRIFGPADIDFAGCNPQGAHGSVTRDYWVIRDPSISGPLTVSLEGLPADVSGTADPQTLTFPGGAIGERVTVNINTIAGPTVLDTAVTLRLVGSGIDLPFTVLVHGSCPQQNRNFVIRGQFGYLNANSVEPGVGFQPLIGAQVEFFRYRSDWYDDKVGETSTDDQGRFSLDLYASIDGDYYARLRLFSPEVEVEDADNSSVWSIDTAHQSNSGGLIEVGTIQISRDGGEGTPRAAVWQGFRNAAREFPDKFGEAVPGGFFKVQIWRGHLTPLTWYDEVHWAHGYRTGEFGNPYRATTHEFSHVFRDVLDGPESHWHGDDLLYVYGRGHGSCIAPVTGSANAGFAFHEGWAEFWSNDTTCCPGDESNQDIEGTVAHDLENLAGKLPGNVSDRRKGMLQVLQRGPNLIHSDEEFRREYVSQFPGIPLGNISDGCSGVENRHAYFELDPAWQRENLMPAIRARQKAITGFKQQQRYSTGLRTFMLRAAIEETSVIIQRMNEQLAELDRGGPPERYLKQAPFQRLRRAEFLSMRRAIQVRALRDACAVVPPEQRHEIERRIRLLEESRIEDAALETLLPLPPVAGDDATTPLREDGYK
ncbi:hypothetical protein [Nitrosospira sp. Is2]|uniref:hypothetical protein n=1 Tax=Nitrosospira sp. Is2 TaxID=3080532 RepID=UPI00295426BD|nr:hypothetical protein [Nitrosospira sp. Is2]WON73847.1 hypothetical protein R5L00_15400 [Nitrosospira sp. Is2]